MLAEGQERAPRGRRRRRLGAGRRAGAPTASARCSSASRRTASCASPAASARASRRPSSTASPKQLERREDSPFTAERRAQAAARVGLRRADARRRGRVHRVDERRRHAPPVLQGAARGGAAVGVPRCRHAGARRRRGARRRAHAEGHEPRQGPVSEGRLHEARRHRVLRARRAGDPAAPRGPAADAQALPQRRRRQVLLREEHAEPPARSGSRSRRSSCRRRPSSSRVCDDLPTLVWLGNLAALELHTSLSRAVPIERPTAMVFDLDPGPPATIVECCRVALILQGMFENLGLKAFPKTSGNKGMQLYVPLNVARRDLRADEGLLARGRRDARGGRARPRRLADGEEPARRQDLHRLLAERRAQDDGQRLLAARPRAPDRVDAAARGTRCAPATTAAIPSDSSSRRRR